MRLSRTNLLAIPFLIHCLLLIAVIVFNILSLPYFDKIVALIIFFFIAFIWLASREVIQSEEFNSNEKVMWLVVLFFLGYIGAALYWYIGRSKIRGTNL